jgi:phosphoserine/homoserine phosphotransferase
MRIVCLDLEGVLIPEIWIAFAEAVGIPELRRTTRDEPDYHRLMQFRLEILNKHRLKLADIQRVVGSMKPLPGAVEFTKAIMEKTVLIVLSDTFAQFVKPLMAKLDHPALLCNTLEIAPDGAITGYKLRQPEGKKQAVIAFKSMNLEIFAAGDSFHDLAMIREADAGCLFRAPEAIRTQHSDILCVDSYTELLEEIDKFLAAGN